RKHKRSLAFSGVCAIVALFGFAGRVFGQAAAPATAAPTQTNAASPAQNAKPADPAEAFWGTLNPYQKSLVEQRYADWAFLAKYRDADKALPAPAAGELRVVFMGDSITEGWGMKATATSLARGELFPRKPYLNRGISGQTTPQMLVRFRQDVIELKPKVVVVLAGTNDIAENTGKMSLGETEGNITSMSELARSNGIRPVLCSVLPASDFWWHKGLQPASKIQALNAWIKEYAAKNGLVYVDYYSAMVNSEGGLKADLSPDGVHPNKAGYEVMAPLAEAGIAEALKKPLP
ncbi:MAG TPA: SGNH/GDSL hydrolase family protein, partial [Candidatus Acidoferrum sp.]|nr:SGNH/GDSL hydrolase family protein [Candidatus Acidoferrum sp.]